MLPWGTSLGSAEAFGDSCCVSSMGSSQVSSCAVGAPVFVHSGRKKSGRVSWAVPFSLLSLGSCCAGLCLSAWDRRGVTQPCWRRAEVDAGDVLLVSLAGSVLQSCPSTDHEALVLPSSLPSCRLRFAAGLLALLPIGMLWSHTVVVTA